MMRGTRIAWFATFMVGACPIAIAGEWSPAVNVNPQSQVANDFPNIALAPDGTAWVTWMGIDPVEGDEEVFYSRWNGTDWNPAQTINPPNQVDDRFPRFSCSQTGDLWVLWKSADPTAPGTYLGLASRWAGTSWSVPDTVWTGGDRHDYSTLHAVSSSEAWFVREGVGGGGYLDVFVYHHLGTARDPVRQFGSPGVSDAIPSITVGNDSEPWVVWYQVPAPPTSAQMSRIWIARRVLGTWSEPESLPEPQGINRSFIVTDASSAKWVICSGRDPTTGPFSGAVWGIRNDGTGWEAPIRISYPLAAPDSELYQLSVGRTCGGNPLAVWVVRDIDNATRADIQMTSWNGMGWEPVERVGLLADSSFAEWPAITRGGTRTWVAYMKGFVSNSVFTTYSDDVPTSIGGEPNLDARNVNQGIQIRWAHSASHDARLSRLWSAAGTRGEAVPDPMRGGRVIHEATGVTGSCLDSLVPMGASVTYWVEFVGSRTRTWAGPVWARRDVASEVISLRVSSSPVRGQAKFLSSVAGAEIEIFDIRGRLVKRLRSPAARSPIAEVVWDGRDRHGKFAPSGVYYARLRANVSPRVSSTSRFVLVR